MTHNNHRQPVQIAPEIAEVPTAPAAPIAAEGITPARPAVELPIQQNDPRPEPTVDPATIAAPIEIPATGAPTSNQTADLWGVLDAEIQKFMKLAPAPAAPFAEPTKAEIALRVMALIEAGTPDGGEIDMIEAAMKVKGEIDAERATYTSAHADRARQRALWTAAVIDNLETLLTEARRELPAAPAPSTVKPASRVKGDAAPRVKAVGGHGAKEKNARLIKFASDLGLPDCVLIDTALNGYTGTLHALRVLPDGTYQPLTATIVNGVRVIGEAVGAPEASAIYFSAPDGGRPPYGVAQMYGLHTGATIVKLDGNVLNAEARTGHKDYIPLGLTPYV